MTKENIIDDSLIEQILTVRNESLRRGSDRLFGRFVVNWQRRKILGRHKVGIRIVEDNEKIGEYTIWSSDGQFWDNYKPGVDGDEVWVIWTYDLSYLEEVASECEEIIIKEIDDGKRRSIKKIQIEEGDK